MAVDILRQILDNDFAPKLLAEKADVGAHDRAQIEEHRLRSRAQAGDEASEHLSRMDGSIRGTSLRLSRLLATTGEQI
jgi:hypothetical protein